MTVASIANPAVKLKPQVYIAKGYSPWYYKNWKDASHVVTTDESASGKATVTCDGNITNMSQMFYCTHITSLDVSNFDTSNVNNMSCMFEECSSLTTLDLSNFDTSNVTSMMGMFRHCSKLTTIKGIIDMKSCIDYGRIKNDSSDNRMFKDCPKLKNVKIKNPPEDFDGAGLSSSQYTIVS